MKASETRSLSDERPVICQVVHALGVGGAEILVDQIVRRLSDRYRCVVATLDAVGELGERLASDGWPVCFLGRDAGIDLKCARRLQQFCERERVDILHAHQYTPFLQSMLSRGVTGDRPVVFTEHGRHVPDCPGRKRVLANRLLLRRRDRLIACGGAVRDALIQNEGLPADRVEVIYNGVDLAALSQPSATARTAIRDEFGFGADDYVAVQIARLHPLKDHRTALRAIDRLRQLVPATRLLLAGDGDERSAIEATVRELGLQDHVRLAGTRSDIADLLQAADVFLLTSLSEGIPLTVIEAMAAERPVVSTDAGGLPEMIRAGDNGILTAIGDAEGLARALQQLHADPARRHRMGRNAQRTAQERFALDRMLQAYADVYDDVLAAMQPRWKRGIRTAEHKAPSIS